MTCKGKSRQTGKACKKQAVPGRAFCHLHGGRNPVGPANGNYKHGRHSTWLKSLPRNLREAAEESLEQGAEIAQDNSIAALDGLIDETASLMDRGASEGLWKALGEHKDECLKLKAIAEKLMGRAKLSHDPDDDAKAQAALYDYETALDSVFTLIEEGVAYAGHRQEMVRLLEQRRKHAETEIKRRTAAFSSMQASQVLALVQSMVELALSHIPERKQKAEFIRAAQSALPNLPGMPGSEPLMVEATGER